MAFNPPPAGPRPFNPPPRQFNPPPTFNPPPNDSTAGGFPHRSDSGNGIFNHPSTNRGGTPGIFSGQPERNPGSLPTQPEAAPTPPKPVDVIVPAKVTTAPENAPHHRPRRIESSSSREEHQRRADLARHNRSGS